MTTNPDPVATDPVATITAHHVELADALALRVDAVLNAVRTGHPHGPAVAALNAVLADQIIPHARAEEDVLYAAAAGLVNARLLVAGMLFEHETLLSLATALPRAPTPVDAATTARALQEVFTGHVRRENQLLAPALAAETSVDLAGLLLRMQERLSVYRDPAHVLPVAGPRPSGTDHELDVRREPPARRHDLILTTFAGTPVGEAFVLVNDHDPKPLHYQFQAEHAGRFTWAYLDSGPEIWRVRIGRSAD